MTLTRLQGLAIEAITQHGTAPYRSRSAKNDANPPSSSTRAQVS